MSTAPSVNYLVGGKAESVRPYKPYGDLQCAFLNALSAELRKDRRAIPYADVMSFAFWCRTANISRLRDDFGNRERRLGIGAVFHIAPSNVPINFAYSYAFGLLAGNANYVRLPSKDYPQVGITCEAINRVLGQKEFAEIRSLTHMFTYQHQDEITAGFSARCEGRIIWGGDETIRKIRQFPIPVRGRDIAFADRYSFCCLDAKSLLALSDEKMATLATGFYNDSYLMDQNACSSPHLVVWIGNSKEVAAAKERFWTHVLEIVKEKYQLSEITAVDKYALLCRSSIEIKGIRSVATHGNRLYRVELERVPENIEDLRGNSGYFYEFCTDDIDTVAPIVNPKYQTLTYHGVEKSHLADFVMKNRLSGIDRIVPVGSALSIEPIWDGYDVISSLSRIIEVH